MKIKKGTVKFIVSIILIIATVLIAYFSFPVFLRGLSYIVRLFLPFILGYIFAAIVRPVVQLLTNKLRVPKPLSAILCMIFVLGILGSIATFIIYKIVNEIRTIYYQFPLIYTNIKLDIIAIRDSIIAALDNLPEGIRNSIQTVFNDFIDKMGEGINVNSVPVMIGAGSFAKALPKAFISIIIFLLSSFFIMCDYEFVSKNIKKVFRTGKSQKFDRVRRELSNYLGGYIKAQGIIMSVAFFIMLIAFGVLGIEYGLIIALAIAFLDALPFFGSGAVLWPWSIISFINGNFKLGFGLVIIYVIIVVTRQFIEPKIVSSKIGMHPLLTLMAMYIGYRIFSIGGMLLGPIILILVISFYKAGVFDGLIRFLKGIWNFIKEEFLLIKDYIKNMLDSKED